MKSKARVLAVDDEEQIRNMIKNVLSDFDYEIFLAKDGTEALETVEEVSPDVILLDIQMPGMNGIEVTKALKQNNKTKIIPVVILSGLHDVDYRIEALEAGADDFLSKPPVIQELITRVKTLVQVKKYNDHMIDHQKELQDQIEKKTKQIKDTSLETVYRLSRAAEFRDEDTGDHISFSLPEAGKNGKRGRSYTIRFNHA
jgi:putative two-component system response regulator